MNLGEEKDTGEGERIVDVEVNPEHGVVLSGVKFVIEREIILIGELRRLFHPLGLGGVDYLGAVGVDHRAIFPFLFKSGDYRHGEKTAIFAQKAVDCALFKELFVVIVDIKNDVGSSGCTGTVGHGVLGRTVANPFHRRCSILIRKRIDFNFLGHHESRVESKTEMADDRIGRVLVFFEELFGAGESNLVDILFDVVGSHAYTVVGYSKRSGFFVDGDGYGEVAKLAFEFAKRRQRFQLLCCVDCV